MILAESNGKTNFSSIEWLTTEAVARHKEGKINEAIAFYLEAIELDENQPAWVYGNAITLMAQIDRWDESLELGEKALKIHPESDEIEKALKTIQQEKKYFKAENENIAKQIKELTTLAVTKHKEGKIDEAIAFYLEVIELDENPPSWVYSNVITLLTQKGFINRAKELGEEALKKYHESDEIYRAMGIVYRSENDLETSVRNYQEAIRLNEKQPGWVYVHLIEYFLFLGKIIEAIELGQKGVTVNPSSSWLYYPGLFHSKKGKNIL